MPEVFFQAVFVIWPIWAHISTAKGSCVRITTLGHCPERDHVVQKRWSCEVVGSDQFSQGDPGFCWGRSGFNWLLIWHFMATGTFLDLDASHHAAVNLFVLGAILVLPLARVPLLKLYCQRATSVLPSCVCYLAHLRPKMSTARAAVQESKLWDSYRGRDHAVQKRWSCEVVGSDQISVCVGESLLFRLLIWHFMNIGTSVKFDASHHAVEVLLVLGDILVLTLARVPLLKLYCRRARSVLSSCVFYLAHLSPQPHRKCGCTRITTLGQLAASRG